MTKREVIGRYKGSAFGIAWSFFNPLLMLAVYTFVFSVVFKARWDSGSDSRTEFALLLFIGMIVHSVVAECLTRSPSLIVGNTNYVKKVVFPLDIFTWVALGATLFHTAASLVIWSAFFLFTRHYFHWTAIFIPLVFLPLVIFCAGLNWFLASLGVFFRDTGQITAVFSVLLLFLSPIFYPVSALPENYQIALKLNPLTFIIEQSRDVLMWGVQPNWSGLGIALLASMLFAWLGFAFFNKTRRGFADVL